MTKVCPLKQIVMSLSIGVLLIVNVELTEPHDVVTTTETVLLPLIKSMFFSKIAEEALYVPVLKALPLTETTTSLAFEILSIFAFNEYVLCPV